MNYELDDADLTNIPCAHGVGIFFCADPACSMPHVMLFGEDNKPMAHFVVPDDGFLQTLVDAVRK